MKKMKKLSSFFFAIKFFLSNRKTEKGFFVRAKEAMKKVKQLSSFSSELKFFVQQENRSNCPSKTKPKYAKSLSHTKIKIFIFCLSADSKFSLAETAKFFCQTKLLSKICQAQTVWRKRSGELLSNAK